MIYNAIQRVSKQLGPRSHSYARLTVRALENDALISTISGYFAPTTAENHTEKPITSILRQLNV